MEGAVIETRWIRPCGFHLFEWSSDVWSGFVDGLRQPPRKGALGTHSPPASSDVAQAKSRGMGLRVDSEGQIETDQC